LQIRLCDLEKKLDVERQRHAKERAALEAELQSSGIRVMPGTPIQQTLVRGVKRKLTALEKSSTDKSLAMTRFRLATEGCILLCNELKKKRLNNVAEGTI
jgi:hypothetical protein